MMMRNKPYTSMQKTYDECYLTCSTAIYFERQENEAEALRSWRSALNQIYHHNAYQVPAGYVPKSETERALQESLKEMELQCKERVDILEALEQSRKDAAKEARSAAKKEKALRKAAEKTGSPSLNVPTASSSTSVGWLGDGTIPPVNFEDLSRPPPLPKRPSYKSRGASTESLDKSRSTSTPEPSSMMSSLPAAPVLPIPSKKVSRSPSPDQRKTTMLTTLRKTDGKKKSKMTIRRPPVASSKAADMAWDTTARASSAQSNSRPFYRKSSDAARVALSRHSLDDSRPGSDDEYRRSNVAPAVPEVTAPSPSDYLPSSSWREPQNIAPVVSAIDDRLKRLSISGDFRSSTPDLVHGTTGEDMPPPPPPHTSTPKLVKPKPPPPRSSKPPALSYRREYPPATLKPGATSIGVRRPSMPSTPQMSDSGIPSEPVSRKVSANSSTPRTTPSNFYPSTSSGSEDSSRPKNSTETPRRRAIRQNSRNVVERPTTPTSSDDSNGDNGAQNPVRAWEARAKAIMKDLPRGIDKEAARQILNDIVVAGDEVHWSDIAGLEGAKKSLKEAVVYPFLRPDLFMGLREPARGMLLFGPPGTGKTMLARAVATESRSTFFAISASSLTSKWHGESEKLVRALFQLAKKLAPSIIFVDEIDSLLSSRSNSSESETSRRTKTEFLIQWSDLQRAAAGRDLSKDQKDKEGDASLVLVLAATNVPWDIDEAARRRFVKRQYIPLPEDETRRIQITTLLSHQKHELSEEDIEVLVQVTEGFSGSDITALAKDAAMGPLRNLGEALLYTHMDQIRPISFKDFEASLMSIRPSVSKEGLKAFDDWAKEFGERGG